MRKLWLAVIGTIVAVAVAAACASRSGTIRGASQAVVDSARGRLAWYQLGCTNGPPFEPVDYRIWELLQREYRLHFETVGGIAPSDYDAEFVMAYDNVAVRILRSRFGADCFERVRKRAAADVYSHDIIVEGCYESVSRTVAAPRHETFWLKGPDPLFTDAAALDRRTVKVEGTVVDIRDSQWRESGRPRLTVRNISGVAPDCRARTEH